MLSQRWWHLYKQLEKKDTTPVWLHGKVLTLREESGEYDGTYQKIEWNYAVVRARVLSLSKLTPHGPDEPLPSPRDLELEFEPFPTGLRSGVEFRVAGQRLPDGTVRPFGESLEI